MPSFPYKLHALLETVTSDRELCGIISWLPDGKSFRIHSQEEFERRVLKDFFPRQKQVKSFMRQLQYYNFENFGDGLFCHPCFRRGQRNLCGQILHQLPTKSQKVCGKSTRPLKQRGRKKKGRSQALESSPEPSTAPYSVTPSSPEPSLPDDASASSGLFSAPSSSHPGDEDHQCREHDGSLSKLVHVSPTCVKEVTRLNKNTEIKDNNVQSEPSLLNAVLPIMSVLPQHQASFLTPQVLAQYEMQAINAARSNYLSCLQHKLMLGSILHSKRGLSSNEQSTREDNRQHQQVSMNSQSMPWSIGSTRS